ncbi:hypothetical protein [Ectopseudomonas mendocina]|nr:hypothetical protein [Pseudomonas mendocina]
MQPSNDTPTSTVWTLIFSGLAMFVLFAACSAAPDALLAVAH